MANRETVTKRLNSAVNQIHRWADIVFPELRQVFKILTCTGATHALQAYKLHLKQLLEEYDLAQQQLKQIEQELHIILERIPYAHKLLEIPGLNATSLAGVLGEAGDLSGYAHGNALLRHAGLNLAEASSGKWRRKMVLSKRGRPRLRHFLYLMTMCMVMTNSEVRALHHYNVKEKKLKKMRSIMKLIGKVARMLVCLAKSGKTYDSTKVFLQAA